MDPGNEREAPAPREKNERWARAGGVGRRGCVVQYQIWRIVFIHRGEVRLMKSGINGR